MPFINAPPQGLRFGSLWCQFEGVSLASSKKKKMPFINIFN